MKPESLSQTHFIVLHSVALTSTLLNDLNAKLGCYGTGWVTGRASFPWGHEGTTSYDNIHSLMRSLSYLQLPNHKLHRIKTINLSADENKMCFYNTDEPT